MKRLEIKKKLKGSGPMCGLRIQNSFSTGPHELSWPFCPLAGLGNTKWEAGSLFPIHRPFRTRRIVSLAIVLFTMNIKKVQGMHIEKCTCLSFSGEFSTSSVFFLSSYSFLKKVDVTKEFEAFLI